MHFGNINPDLACLVDHAKRGQMAFTGTGESLQIESHTGQLAPRVSAGNDVTGAIS